MKLPFSTFHILAATSLAGLVACFPSLGTDRMTGSPRDALKASNHLQGWMDPVGAGFHGAIVRSAGYDYTLARVGNLSCNTCHAGESPFQASPNLRAPNCFACHDGGPDGSAFHPRGWLDIGSKNFHGDVVISFGQDTARARLSGALGCAACHAVNSPTEPSINSRAPSCFACHGGGPDGSANHPEGWLDPSSSRFHGAVVEKAGFDHTTWGGTLTCSACHGGYTPTEQSPNSKAPNCFACHAGGPDGSPGHKAGWGDPGSGDFHGKVVKAAGNDFTRARAGGLTCNACHAGLSATQQSPAEDAPSCFACHAGGPDGSSDHPAGWAELSGGNFHGKVVALAGYDFKKAKAGRLSCDACHAGAGAGDQSPNLAAPNCFACHSGGPSGKPGHPAGWSDLTSPAFHGSVVKAAGNDYTLARSGGLTCNTCHAGEKPSQASPVASAPSCFSCHEGGPTGKGHRAGWADPRDAAFHGKFLAKNGGNTCTPCHSTTADVPSPWSQAPTCTTCHQGGPSGKPGHPAGWVVPDADGVPPHAKAAKADLNVCGRCHNTVGIGKLNPAPDVRLDCWSCHTGPGG